MLTFPELCLYVAMAEAIQQLATQLNRNFDSRFNEFNRNVASIKRRFAFVRCSAQSAYHSQLVQAPTR